MIRLQYQVELDYEVRTPAGADFIFNVHAAHTEQQTVVEEHLALSQPVIPDVATDPATHTRFMRLHADQGTLHLNYRATVDIAHHRADPGSLHEVPMRCLPLEVLPYVYPSRYCQSDRLLRMALTNFGNLWQGYSRVLAIQHWVQQHVTFASNTTNSNTSAIDTLIERVGVCRDFTHLMIALCRALNIPARIGTGTDYGADPALGPPDFHAYVEVYLGDRWYLFDASGTGVPMGFLRLGTGRDAADVAFATIFGDVVSKAPSIQVRALEGEGLETPHHCADALSTAAASPLQLSGCASFDSKAGGAVAQGPVLKQLPD
ncbi:transglutaminase family protein [Variovorax defluvii]|uniref:Transglutaminase family protein n=1 Tax=Variovorax defluvii TaxID=913761 RepID=A0ABP8HGW0_9BURK